MATLQELQANQAAGTTELAKIQNHPVLGKTSYLEARKDLLGAGIPGHMSVEREIRTAAVMLMQSKDLRKATPLSFYVAVSVAVNSGIGLGNGKGYLVAYGDVVNYVPGWKGMVDLVSRTGRASAWTGVVHKGDHFEYALGDSPFLTHKPGDNEDHADITHYYAIGRVKGSEWPHIVVWSVAKVIKHLTTYNKVGGKHYALKNDDNMEAYGRKVVLLQVLKYLPSSQELENAIIADNAHEAGKKVTLDGNFAFIDDDEDTPQDQAEEHPRTDAPEVKPDVTNKPKDYDPYATEDKPTDNGRRRDAAETVEVRDTKPATSTTAASEQSSRVVNGAVLTPEASEVYERLMAQLNKANSMNQLADAYEQVGEVNNQELRNALTTLYRQRYAEFNKPAAAEATAEAAAPAKRTRRTGSTKAPE